MGSLSTNAQMTAGVYQGYAFDTLTIDTTAGGTGLTVAKYKPSADGNLRTNADRGASRVVITVETASVRYTYDGTTPTAAIGHLAQGANYDSIVLIGDDAIKNFRAIATGSSATLQVTYER